MYQSGKADIFEKEMMMQNDSLMKKLEFLKEIDRLKTVVRQSPILDQSRKENSAEHSWHLAMYALVLAEYAVDQIDIARVIQMLLIHDIVEVDAGDTPIHGTDDAGQAERERNAAQRLYGLLPAPEERQLRSLWEEFEEGKTNDARFAKAIDRFQPTVANVFTGGGTWLEGQVPLEEVLNKEGATIKRGAPELWQLTEMWITEYFN